MASRFEITLRAKEDLYNIWLYSLEAWGEAQADKYIGEFFERFEWLAV
jgi:plasmid stabilization system protein ParE